MILGVHPLIALGVLASTAATDAAYVFFNAAVSGRRRFWAANWSAIWYLLSAFAVISYTVEPSPRRRRATPRPKCKKPFSWFWSTRGLARCDKPSAVRSG